MSDDLDLLERFEPLASATFAPTTRTDVLRARAERRRRRRALAVGAALAGVVLAGALVAFALPGARPVDQVQTVAPVPTPSPTTTVVRDTFDPDAFDPGPVVDGPGWYVPTGLPSGWTTERAEVQGTDGSGQAVLWMWSPAGNQLVVTLSVPNGERWWTDDVVEHPLEGVTEPVLAWPPYDDLGGGGLASLRPGAIVRVDWPGGAAGAAETAAEGELDLLMGSLQPVDVEGWRTFLATVPSVRAPLLEATTLEALPDET